MRLARVWIFAVLSIACGGDDVPGGGDPDGGDQPGPDAMGPQPGDPDAGGGPDDPDAAATPAEIGNDFAAAAMPWSVPGPGTAEGFFDADWFGDYRYWTTLDLDGDGQVDIVQTGDPAAPQRVWDAAGSPYWKVFRGGDWSSPAIEWSVPPSGQIAGFFGTGVTNGGYEWETVDLDGDRRPDLIHTVDPATGRVWDVAGAPHWKVYLNTGAGFAANALLWSVPDAGTFNGFFKLAEESGTARWATLDVDGDRQPDLLQTSDPATGRVWDATAAPHWKVFRNDGSGFAADPTLWSVPDSGTSNGFYGATVESGWERWRTFDLDGDGRRDLVQTADPATGRAWDAAGAPHWKLYRGQAGGFAAASTQWAVPPSGLSDGFFTAAANESYRRWLVIDLDGDGLVDLVQPGDTSHGARVWDAAGAPYWKLFRNTGTGFSAALHRWSVPMSGASSGFYTARAGSGTEHWDLFDVDGDRRPDLVQTADPATSRVWDAAGSPYWKIYLNIP